VVILQKIGVLLFRVPGYLVDALAELGILVWQKVGFYARVGYLPIVAAVA